MWSCRSSFNFLEFNAKPHPSAIMDDVITVSLAICVMRIPHIPLTTRF